MVKLYPLRGKGAGAGLFARHLRENDYSLDAEASLEAHEMAEYYGEGAEIVGEWRGKLAEELGLTGRIETEEERKRFVAALGGRLGRQWLTKGGHRMHITAWDVNMSAPKSVSVLAMLDPKVVEDFKDSVREAYDEVERFAARRVRHGIFRHTDEEELTQNLAGAIFVHDSSRSGDPQLHAHCLTLSATRGSDGQLYALQTREIARAIRYLSRYQEAALARRLAARGYEIELTRRDGKIEGWRVRGVSEEVERLYSERAEQIRVAVERELERRRSILEEYRAGGNGQELREWLRARGEKWSDSLGRSLSGEEITVLTRQTRDPKLVTTPKALRERQWAKLDPAQLEELRRVVARAAEGGARPEACRIQESAYYEALDHVFERRSVAAAHHILAEALTRDPLLDVRRLKEQAAELPRLVDAPNGLSAQVSTSEMIALERYCVETARAGMGRLSPLSGGKLVLTPPRLQADQARAYRYVLESKDQVLMVEGIAGAGKTRLVKDLSAFIKARGRSISFLSPTRGGAEALRNEGLTATTVQSYIKRRQAGSGYVPDVLVVDEAGMVGVRDGEFLLRDIRAKGSRIVLLGDIKQHQPVPAGDWMRLLRDHAGVRSAKLTEVRRQRNLNIKQAVKLLEAGELKAALTLLDDAGHVQLMGRAYLAEAAQAYLEESAKGGSVLGIARTWAEIRELTKEVRAGLRDAKQLSGEDVGREMLSSYDWTQAQARSIRSYGVGMTVAWTDPSTGLPRHGTVASIDFTKRELTLRDGTKLKPRYHLVSAGEKVVGHLAPGDKIRTLQNNKELGVINGYVYTVDAVERDGTIRTREGVTIPPEYVALTHGYFRTCMSSQGLKADTVIYAANRTTARDLYVGVSRAVERLRIFSPDRMALHKCIGAGFMDRTAVMDLTALFHRATQVRRQIDRGWQKLAAEIPAATQKVRNAARKVRDHVMKAARMAASAVRPVGLMTKAEQVMKRLTSSTARRSEIPTALNSSGIESLQQLREQEKLTEQKRQQKRRQGHSI